MKAIQRIKICYFISVISLTFLSIVIMLMPWASEQAIATNDNSVRIVGVIFWVLTLLGYGSLAIANARRKRYWIKRFGRDIQKNYRPGILCFSANKIAEVFDIMMAIFFIVSFVVALTPWKNTFFFIALLSLLIWAVNMHSLFNGRIYRINKYKKGEKKL